MSVKPAPASPKPSATILLLREHEGEMQVLMVVRHHQIDFASGALVFPGGKVDPRDHVPEVRARACGAADMDEAALALRAAAIREAFEESGVLLARKRGEDSLVSGAELAGLQSFRDRLNAGETGIGALLEAADLELACDLLVSFAHWITPEFMPKRFDTHFFLAEAPGEHVAIHDGGESVDSVWIHPQRALAEAEAGKWTIIFPTRMNLVKLARSGSVAEAMASARASPVVCVEPWIEQTEDGPVLCISEEAGYGAVREPLDSLR
ncbi:MAG: NUDIX hydrolase [Alphaproteobacteria bacterium]